MTTRSRRGDGQPDPGLNAAMSERRRLINLAYRLLGSLAEAEDAVQETYARWYALSRQQHLQAWNVVTGRLNGQPIALSSGGDGSIYTWDLTARKRIGTMQNGTPDNPPDLKHGVRGLALAYPDGPDGAPVVITGSDHRSVRVWSLADQRAIGQMPARQLIPLAWQENSVWGLALTAVAGTHYAVTACLSGQVRTWNLDPE